MPELPEVQTTVNGIKKHVVGLTILDAWTDYGSKFHAGKDNIANPIFFKSFRKAVVGTKIIDSTRRGKNVLIHLSNNKTILIHMKMTGHVMYGEYKKSTKNTKKTREEWVATEAGPLRDDPYNRFVHFLLHFKNGKSMALSDTRKFAKVTLIETDQLEKSSHLASHGPEPLEVNFKLQDFKKALMIKPNGPIKIVMMNHEVISGIGNIYASEILFLAKVAPQRLGSSLNTQEIQAILEATQLILNQAILHNGTSISDFRRVDDKTGEFQNFLKDMYDTMKIEGGIGIAAPQVNVSKQVALIELPAHNEL